MVETNLLEGKRVLVLDDEPDVPDVLEILLSMCEVVKATSYEEAKRALETQRFDMAILDIMGVRGYEVLKIANQKDVIAVMLTAHAPGAEYIIKSYKEGAAFHIPKDEMANIATFLNDLLEAKQKGENFWSRFLKRLGPYYDKRLGADWRDETKEIWEKLQY